MELANETSVLPKLLAFPIPRPIEGALEHVLGLRDLASLYGSIRAMGQGRPLCERLLTHLEVSYRVSPKDMEQIPRSGAAVLVVNHPFGILEGAVLATLLARIRGDVKLLANGVLTSIPELRDLIASVDPMAGSDSVKGNGRGLRQAIRHLTGGGLLVVFPAGGVSHFQWKGLSVSDPKWNTGVARLVEIVSRRVRKLCIIPAFVEGANGLLFQALGVLHPRLRTALLARELLNKRKAHVCVRVGSAVSAEKLLAIPTDIERVKYLRWRTYLLARREEYKPRFSFPLIGRRQDRAAAPIAAPIDPESLARDIRALPAQCLLARSGDLAVYIAGARRLPNVLAEIGRLREVTFRAVGEGTGAATDVDRFDFHYLHLFVWNEVRQEIVGAYRMAGADKADVSDLYTATLFEYGNAFVRRLGPALELGRSFVRPEYQKGFAPLLLLWKGIGKYIAQNPRYKVLFGPVSISNSYQALSRDLMVSFLEREASLSDWIGLVSTRNPFRRRSRSSDLPRQGFGIEDLSDVVSDLEPSRTGIPVLLRQYLKLGGKLLGFNVDPRFSNALDGLIVVDLTKTEPKLLDRYLGAAEARAFLDYQKGSNQWNSQKAC